MNAAFVEKLYKRLHLLNEKDVQGLILGLIHERGYLQSVFQALKEGVILLDDNFDIQYANPAALAFFGVNLNDVIGQPLSSSFKGLAWEESLKEQLHISRNIEIFYPENRILNFYIASISEKNKLGYVLLIRDLTESFKKTEEQFENKQLSSFHLLAAGLAHELGNPLNSLTIHLQLLKRRLQKLEIEDKKVFEHLEVASCEIKRLDGMISDFLTAVRPSKPQLEEMILLDLVKESLEVLSPEIKKAKVRLKLEFTTGFPKLWLDGLQIKQVIMNLILNACQAMEKGGELWIYGSYNDYEVRLSFQDSGKGMSGEEMQHLFQPFYTTKKKGSGLGLMTVQRIIREHGGQVEVKSSEGKQTTVTLLLPLTNQKTKMLGFDLSMITD
jgi:PAS domain S-box-containing protein